MFKINIVTQLLCFFVLAIFVNYFNFKALLVSLMLLLAMLMWHKTQTFLHALRRFRWFFLVMLLIFSLNTPGEHLANWPFAISPTYEGLAAGFTQMLRVIVMLACVSLLLGANTKQQLIAGFYFLLQPLSLLGIAVERFAARLWLTLHYVELQTKQTQLEPEAKHNIFTRLKNMAILDANTVMATDEALVTIDFKLPQFHMVDYAVIALLLAAVMKVLV